MINVKSSRFNFLPLVLARSAAVCDSTTKTIHTHWKCANIHLRSVGSLGSFFLGGFTARFISFWNKRRYWTMHHFFGMGSWYVAKSGSNRAYFMMTCELVRVLFSPFSRVTHVFQAKSKRKISEISISVAGNESKNQTWQFPDPFQWVFQGCQSWKWMCTLAEVQKKLLGTCRANPSWTLPVKTKYLLLGRWWFELYVHP